MPVVKESDGGIMHFLSFTNKRLEVNEGRCSHHERTFRQKESGPIAVVIRGLQLAVISLHEENLGDNQSTIGNTYELYVTVDLH